MKRRNYNKYQNALEGLMYNGDILRYLQTSDGKKNERSEEMLCIFLEFKQMENKYLNTHKT
jgi:hypothetical protein